jgi:peptidoglycan/xylan/chitin deacetylase (PgdA/CDA1 family)
VRSAVPRILELFEQHQIHGTWATVGLLFCRDRQELQASLPRIKPRYRQERLSPYPRLREAGWNEQDDPFRYGSSLIEQIRSTPHQEIGTHTFSHYYCLEDGQTEASFRSDLEAAIAVAASRGIDLRSLVFPRNQVNPAYLQTLRDLGIQSYRGNGSSWIYRQRKRSEESSFRRAVRLLDAYLNLSGHNTIAIDQVRKKAPFDFPASRLLRAYSPALKMFEPLRVARICSGIDHAARTRRAFHLWFHPEELTSNLDENMAALKKVLGRYVWHRDQGDMESLGMAELSRHLLARESAGDVEPEYGVVLLTSQRAG